MERIIAEKLARSKINHPTLNPVLFEEDGTLNSLVRDKILEIVGEFLEYIQVDIRVSDVRLVGSNAAYNYTPQSDIDVHIITDLSKISDPEIIARLYFDAIKRNFKDSYDIKIKGIDVEIYVEDINTGSVSNGIYSVTNNEWVKEPTPVDAPSDEVVEEAEQIASDIVDEIKGSNSMDELQNIVDKIYMLRKNSLAKEGEYGAGNLAFKILRNNKVLEKISKLMKDITSQELSLESKKIISSL